MNISVVLGDIMGKRRRKYDPIWGITYEEGSLLDQARALDAMFSTSNLESLLNQVEYSTMVKEKPRKGIPRGLLVRLLVRSQGRCENCNRSLRDVKVHIHHKNYDPTDNRESNLMVLCKDCHLKLTGPPPRGGETY